MVVPVLQDRRTYAHAVELLTGAQGYHGGGTEKYIEFSHGTWRQKQQKPSEAVLRRTWTDMNFDLGEDANLQLVQTLETEFAAQLACTMQTAGISEDCEKSGENPLALSNALAHILGTDTDTAAATISDREVLEVLNQTENLGASLDMIGVYLKNYMTDKADLVLRRTMPLCRKRGGLWLIKALNISACVCSKQDRHEEALEALEELDRLVRSELGALGHIGADADTVAWAFFDMVYKNFGWTLESLGRHAEAFSYFERAVEVKRANGVSPTWFDQWDIGKALVRRSYMNEDAVELRCAGGILREALALQKSTDPTDIITRSKLLKSNGECCVALGELAFTLEDRRVEWEQAESFHREARDLFEDALGPSSPLTGWACEDLAAVLLRLRRFQEARDMLHQALHCESLKDVIQLPKVDELLHGLLVVHRATGDVGSNSIGQHSMSPM